MKHTYFALYTKHGVSGLVKGDAENVRNTIYNADNVRALHKIKGGIPEKVNLWDFTHKTEKENFEHCKRISDELDLYIDGAFCNCPNCGETHNLQNAGDFFKCPNCGDVNAVEDWETLGLYDYFSDVLDIDYIISSDRKTVRGARFLVAYGGPNIYIDSFSGSVELYWWSDRASYPMRRETIDALDDFAQEMWGCY